MYYAAEGGHSVHDIAAAEGLPYASTLSALNYLRKYLKGKTRGQSKHSRNYREAAKLIRQGQKEQPPERTTAPQRQPQPTSSGDHFTFLKRSFERFQGDVATFLEVEINSRYTALRDENRALAEDNKALRKEVASLRAEIDRLQEEPQTVDWVASLQSKLAKEEV